MQMRMRKIYYIVLTIFVSLATLSASAQDIAVKKDSIGKTGSASEAEIVTHNIIYNNTNQTQTIHWVRTESVPNSWMSQICDMNQCYTPDVDSQHFDLAPNDSGILDVHFLPNNAEGKGKVTLYVYMEGKYNQGITSVNYVDAWPAGMNSRPKPDFFMYPSPVRNYLTVKFPKKGKHTIEVYNILGRRLIKRQIDNTDMMKISFTRLQSGMYVIMYKDEDGNVITKTISKD